MKKSICYVFYMLVALLLFWCDTVYGDTTHDIIYDIEKLNFKKNEFTIKGFAFIDHYDNYGGVTSNYKNLTTTIIASTRDNASSPSNFNNRNSISFVADNKEKDLYATRCIGGGCSSTVHNDRIKNRTETLDCSGSSSDSRCSYHDVGFEVTISYKELFDKFSNAGDGIYFYIQCELKYKSGLSSTKLIRIGVNEGACIIKGESKCRVNEDLDIDGSDYTFRIGALDDHALMTATYARIMNDSYSGINGNWFKDQRKYKIDKYVDEGPAVTKCLSDGTHCVTSSKLNYYKLQVDHRYGSGSNWYYPGNSASYYAHASWVQVEGKFLLKNLKKNPNKVGCSGISNWDDTDGTTVDKSVNCGGEVNYKSCRDDYQVSGTVYFRSAYGGDEKISKSQCGSFGGQWYDDADDGEGRCFLPVNFTASLSILEQGNYKMGGVSSSTLKNGQPFNFSNSSYTNTISWVNSFVGDRAYNFQYGNAYDYSCTNKGCSAHVVTFQDWYGTAKKDGISERNAVYADRAGNQTRRKGISNVAEIYVNNELKNKFDDNYRNFNGKLGNMYKSSVFSSANFPGDWSMSSISPLSDVTLLDAETNTALPHRAKSISASYNYGLRDGYLNIKNRSITYDNSVSTSADYVNFGKRLYIPLKYSPGKAYSISLARSPYDNGYGISFVDGIYWGITGTCNVNATAGLYDCPDGGCDGGGGGGNCDPTTNICDGLVLNVAYRPISVNEPFPAGAHTPINWSNYISAHGLDRIKKSYTYKPDYTYNGTLNFNSDGKYGNWNNIDPSGASRFVTNGNGFNVNANGDNYCGLGSYSDSCNKVG